MRYVDWEYYSALYSDVGQEDFERINPRACAKLDVYTHMRAAEFEVAYDPDAASAFQRKVHGQIMDTVCALINLMYVQEASGAGNGLASVSNDGYSESYKITTQAEKESEVASLIYQGLSGTGLAGAL